MDQGFLISIIALATSFLITPLIIKLAFKIGAVDYPGERRVHSKAMPRIGGLSIILAFTVSFLIIAQFVEISYLLLIAALIIGLVGFLDDLYQLSPKLKLFGQSIAVVVVIFSGVTVNVLSIPFSDQIYIVPTWLSISITFLWIIGITNAVNLIDGLDGLAGGVSVIAGATILFLAVLMGNYTVILLSIALIGSTLGFLYYNFHPAKIFMGDSGALFLGFILAIISLMGFKQATTVSLIIPFIILGVPITDTLIAIVRRLLNKTSVTAADKNHLHHKLLEFGYSHRQTVLFIYGIALLFGFTAISFSQATLLGSTIIFIALVLFIEILIEKFGLISKTYHPLLNFFNKLVKQKQYTK